MTERIDHAARARLAIQRAQESLALTVRALGTADGDLEATDLIVATLSQLSAYTSAQAEATLALVEQQRIQNVFYLAREVHADIIAGLDELGVNSHEIAAALGIQEVQS